MSPEEENSLDGPAEVDPPAETPPAASEGPLGVLESSFRVLLVTTSLLSGLCRFVPVPLLDDFLVRKVRKYLISKILERRGRGYGERRIEPLYANPEGCLTGGLGWLLSLPLRLIISLMKKIFKTALIVLTLRDATLTIAWTLLMGRTVNRLFKLGELPDRGDSIVGIEKEGDPLWAEALLVRTVFDEAFRGSDLRLLQGALEGALRSVKGLTKKGAQAVRVMFRWFGGGDAPKEMPERAKPVVSAGVESVLDVLAQEEIVTFMTEFDVRFDKAYQRAREQQIPALPAHSDED